MTYTALTIGPITRTILTARKTKDLWAASYLFSYIMKKTIEMLSDTTGVLHSDFLIPYVDKAMLSDKNVVGIFPDRLIFKSNSSKTENLRQAVDKTLETLFTASSLVDWAKQYFKTYIVEIEAPDDKTAVQKINDYLDVFELQDSICQKESKNYLNDIFKTLSKDATGREDHRIPMLAQIATQALRKREKDILKNQNQQTPYQYEKLIKQDDDSSSMKNLESYFKSTLKTQDFKGHHKYLCVVQADGDNIGETIKNLQGSYQDFSQALSDFRKNARQIIRDFATDPTDKQNPIEPIYIGGDDLLFFTPVVNHNGKTIWNLIADLDRAFARVFADATFQTKPTLSFGVAIAYYKFPLYESIELAYDLLKEAKKRFEILDDINAKQPKKETTSDYFKSAVCMRVTKHSGSYFDVKMPKNAPIYSAFSQVLNTAPNDPKKFLNSMMYNLQGSRVLLSHIVHNETRLNNYFVNNYDEDIHQKPQMQTLFENASKIVAGCVETERFLQQKTKKYKEDSQEAALKNAYGSFRFLKFVNGLDNE